MDAKETRKSLVKQLRAYARLCGATQVRDDCGRAKVSVMFKSSATRPQRRRKLRLRRCSTRTKLLGTLPRLTKKLVQKAPTESFGSEVKAVCRRTTGTSSAKRFQTTPQGLKTWLRCGAFGSLGRRRKSKNLVCCCTLLPSSGRSTAPCLGAFTFTGK